MSEESDFARLLVDRMQPYCTISQSQVDRLYRHYQLLCRWNKAMSLTTVTGLVPSVERHYCESLFAALHLPPSAKSVGDVGSGAGFPGIPLAILKPDVRVVLIEAQQKKAAFLREASDGLLNVCVRAVRSENWTETVDVLTSRAVRSEDIVSMVPRNAPRVLLMVGREDLTSLGGLASIQFDEPITMPWGDRRLLVRGVVAAGL